MSVQADAGGSMGTAVVRTDLALYGLQRPLSDPDCILVTRITCQDGKQKVDRARIGYDQAREAKQAGALEAFLQAAF
jgi:hypothetical protein